MNNYNINQIITTMPIITIKLIILNIKKIEKKITIIIITIILLNMITK